MMKVSPIFRYLIPPNLGNETWKQKGRILHVALLTTAIAVIPMAVLNLQATAYGFANLLFAISLLSLIATVLHHKGYYRLAASYLSAVIFIAIAYTIIDGAGLNDPGVATLPIFIMISSVFFEKRGVGASTLLSVALLVVLYFLNQAEIIVLASPVTSSRVIILSILMTATGVITWTIVDLRTKTLADLAAHETMTQSYFANTREAIFCYEYDPPISTEDPISGQIARLYEGVLVECNTIAAKMYGYNSPEEALGKRLIDLFGTIPGSLDDFFGAFIKDGYATIDSEATEVLQDGSERYFLNNGTGVIEGGKLLRVWGSYQDITGRKLAEETLRQSEEKFSKVFMASPYSMSITRMSDERIVEINEGFSHNTGYAREEVLNHTALELGLFKDPQSNVRIAESVQRSGNLRNYEAEMVTRDGQNLDVLFSSEVIRLNHEPHLVSIGLDVTEQKEAEKSLRESDARNRLILGSLPMVFYRAQPDVNYGGTWVSEQITQLTGYPPEKVISPTFWNSRLHPDDRKRVMRAFDDLPLTETLEIEYRWQRADGSYFWVQDNAVLLKDDDGHPQEIVGTWIDMSDRKASERALQESEFRYRTLFEGANDALLIILQGRFIDCNAFAQKLFGYARDELIGLHPGDLSPEFQPDRMNSHMRANELMEKAEAGDTQRFFWVHHRRDGSAFPAEVDLHRIEIQNEKLLLAVVRDISERKQAEEAALEERQRLARDLHDAVSQTLWSASLIADVLPAVWQQDQQKGLERLDRLRQLTRGALAEMRTLLLELRPKALVETELSDLLSRLVEATASRSGAYISQDFKDDCLLPEDVHVAIYRITQEALSNATRHAEAQNIDVQLRCDLGKATLKIRDDGSGFDPNRTRPGQHLGLQIMRERATSVGAELGIESKPQEGTLVSFEWQGAGEASDER